jgi:hypothetical protein
MTRNQKPVSTVVETLRRGSRIAAGTFVVTMLLPTGAPGMDSAPKFVLPLPSIRYLDSMRWMDWKLSAPVFKIDTLLLPDSTQPGVFRLPSDYERDLPRVG